MKVRIFDLYYKEGNELKELCKRNGVKYSFGKIDDVIYEEFTFVIGDNVVVLSTAKGVTVAIKTGEFFELTKDYIFIPSSMFGHIEII